MLESSLATGAGSCVAMFPFTFKRVLRLTWMSTGDGGQADPRPADQSRISFSMRDIWFLFAGRCDLNVS